MRSRIAGFYKLGPEGRLHALLDAGVPKEVVDGYRGPGLPLEAADLMVENVVGTFTLPNAVAVNFRIDGVDRLVPMVVEEPSVVAAVSNVARLAREGLGFETDCDPSVMIAQIQVVGVHDADQVCASLREALPRLRAEAIGVHPRLEERGGGVVGFEIRPLRYEEPGRTPEDMVVLHVLLDCVDAMGANMLNTLAEQLAPTVEEVTGCPVALRILSNLADKRRARARVRVAPAQLSTDDMDGALVAQGIAQAWRFAWADPYRAATHNKGVMNGIDAVALATGNDWRAIEAGAHAWCCRDGQYRPMTRWEVDARGDLIGTIDVPMQFGTVGGPIRVHPTVQHNLAMLGATGARDLAGVAVAVGLAQNLGALKALATEGIQCGHMRMHARTVAATAGATSAEVARVTTELVRSRDFSVENATPALTRLRAVEASGG
jgi:hydroxymethylglutaryl-CoA reductase